MTQTINPMPNDTYLEMLRRDIKVPVDNQEELKLVMLFGSRLLVAAAKVDVEKALRKHEYDCAPYTTSTDVVLENHLITLGEDVELNYTLTSNDKSFSNVNPYITYGHQTIRGLFLKLCTSEEIIFSDETVTCTLDQAIGLDYNALDLLNLKGYVRPLVYYFDGKLRILALGEDGELVRYV